MAQLALEQERSIYRNTIYLSAIMIVIWEVVLAWRMRSAEGHQNL
jgi:hypothetical protein